MDELLFYRIFECATTLFETFIVYQYLNGLFEKRDPDKSALKWYIVFWLGLSFLTLYLISSYWLTVYILLFTCFLSLHLYKTTLHASIIAVICFAVIMMSTEFFTTGLIGQIFDISISSVVQYGWLRVFAIIVTKLAELFLIKSIISFLHWKNSTSQKNDYKLMLPLLLCQLILILLTYFISIICRDVYGAFSMSALCAMLGVLFISLVIFWYFDRIKAAYAYRSQNEAMAYKLALEKQYQETLLAHQQQTDALWHDMKKHLRLIKELSASAPRDLSADYIHSLEVTMDEQIKIIRTNYPVLSALLTEQLRRARAAGVPYDIDVRLKDPLRIEPVDLCVILGNLFDNALEACQLMPETAERKISLFIGQRGNIAALDITNTFLPETRTRWHDGPHGLGLRNVQQMVDKYGGRLRIQEDDNTYTVNVLFL